MKHYFKRLKHFFKAVISLIVSLFSAWEGVRGGMHGASCF